MRVGSCCLQYFPHAPDVVRDPRCHSGGNAKRLVDASEVIPAIPKRDRCPVVFPFLTESVREACETTHSHSEAEIGPLDYRSADALRIRTAHDRDYLHRLHFGGAVAFLAV